jgi:hypothetical protein
MFACIIHNITNRIGGVIVSVLASSEVDRGFKPPSGQDFILHSLFKFTYKKIYMVNILRYPDIMKTISKKNISYSTCPVYSDTLS